MPLRQLGNSLYLPGFSHLWNGSRENPGRYNVLPIMPLRQHVSCQYLIVPQLFMKARIIITTSRSRRPSAYLSAIRFMILREKFGRLFLDVEYHWDAGHVPPAVGAPVPSLLRSPPRFGRRGGA